MIPIVFAEVAKLPDRWTGNQFTIRDDHAVTESGTTAVAYGPTHHGSTRAILHAVVVIIVLFGGVIAYDYIMKNRFSSRSVYVPVGVARVPPATRLSTADELASARSVQASLTTFDYGIGGYSNSPYRQRIRQRKMSQDF